jgi:hypothetical protein
MAIRILIYMSQVASTEFKDAGSTLIDYKDNDETGISKMQTPYQILHKVNNVS